MIPVSPELVRSARKGRRDAVVELLAEYYAMVWRMAAGLTGRDDVARGIVRFIMQRSLRALPSWKDEGAPTRWFQHHTLLTSRRTLKHSPNVTNDTLLPMGACEPHYVAFIRALRGLPMQQREAFILYHGEKMQSRSLAVAMDCSLVAAENHLREATERLRELSGGQLDIHIQRMARMYQSLSPDEQLTVQDIRKRIGRFVLPWFVKKIFKTIVSLVLLVFAVWGGWWIWQIVEHSVRMSGK